MILFQVIAIREYGRKGIEDMILVKNIRDIEVGLCDETWAIVRSMKQKSQHIKQVVDLSPSWDLFKKYRDMSEKGEWGKEEFENIFVPQFLNELDTNVEAKNLLNYLYRADRDKKIIGLVCYCNDESTCHRSIIAGLLHGVGCSVKTEKGTDYSRYYDMFRRL